jgi:hypothetical protein
MYYGFSGSDDQQDEEGVWDNGYEAVWHLAEASGAGAYLTDSSENNHDGTPANTNYNTSGKIDGARSFRYSGAHEITITNSGELFDSWDFFALEFWIYPDYSSDAIWEASDEDMLFDRGGPIRLGRIRRNNFNDPNMGEFQMDVEFNTYGNTFMIVDIDRRQWNHIVYCYDGSYYRGFVNGQQQFSTSISNDRLISGTQSLYLGDASSPPNATLDEVRISNVTRSVDWYVTQYNNQNNTTSFYKISNEETISASSSVGYEWVELYNTGDTAIDLTGWYLSDNDGYIFNLSGAGSLPVDGYLVCRLGQSGTNSSTNLYGPIIYGSLSPTTMLEITDDLAVINNNGIIIDYVAWGCDAGTDDDNAVTWLQWTNGQYVDTSELVENETIGRDQYSTDTDLPADWENSSNSRADPFGIHATNQTVGTCNVDHIIPEFDILAIPMMIIAVAILYFNRYYNSFHNSNQNSDKNKRRNKIKRKR